MKLSTIAPWVGGQLLNRDANYQGISTDTRTLKPQELFIALSGEQFDGHEFVAMAIEKGAAAVMVSRAVPCDIPQLQVQDTTIALGKLAAHHRANFNIPVIGITGSCGKTTVKTMTASILSHSGSTLASARSFNNAIGVPLTLLELNTEHRYAVIEMGMNHFGEIATLTQMTKPTIALINNAAAAHLEGVGSLEGVARAKGEIFQGLTPEGIGILNLDDPFAAYWRDLLGEHPILTFGTASAADFRAENSTLDHEGKAQFTLITPLGETAIQLPLLGSHNINNALAAAAASYAAGADLPAIQQGLQTAECVYRRLNLHRTQEGARIIDDSYNANPLSLQAAITTLAQQPGYRILVLGDMRELGDQAEHYHHAVGISAKEAGIEQLFAYGELSQFAVKSFGAMGHHFQDHASLVAALKPLLHANTTVLIKGSFSTRMDKVVQGLVTGQGTPVQSGTR